MREEVRNTTYSSDRFVILSAADLEELLRSGLVSVTVTDLGVHRLTVVTEDAYSKKEGGGG